MKKEASTGADALETYRKKRDFALTPEPSESEAPNGEHCQYVIQKHWASRLHYDLRLEINGTMKSWAVPKGPSLDPSEKRMAVQVEDHPLSYNTFEGQIPAKQYGAGKVIVWDSGFWVPSGDAVDGYRDGKLKFELHGAKLKGHWTLVRMRVKGNEKHPSWLLIKEQDSFARSSAEFSVVDELPDSVQASGFQALTTPIPRQNSVRAPKRSKKARAVLPENLSPQLATLVNLPPSDASEWMWELKFDGYRLMARVQNGAARLFTRNGNDWTDRLPNLVEALRQLPLKSGWLDGEIVLLDSAGKPDFQALQNAFGSGALESVVYFVFDLPYANGDDLRNMALDKRRETLRAQFENVKTDRIRVSENFEVRPSDLLSTACRMGFEGVVGKRKSAVYVSRRNADWIKIKCTRRQEFVVCGFTDPKGSRAGFGALILGIHDDSGALVPAGSVGAGFAERSLTEIYAKLKALESSKKPFSRSAKMEKAVHWVAPLLVVEVAFAQWTQAGRIRHAVFHGLRTDKPACDIVREVAQHLQPDRTATNAAEAKTTASRKLAATGDAQLIFHVSDVSHADRVIDKLTGTTKLDIVRYYAKVGPLMMVHLNARPVSLVRAPHGVGGELFFQKHLDKMAMEGVMLLNKALDEGHAPLLEVMAPTGLLAAAQMNVLEFHTWNARKDRIERPDRMTFDLDPGDGIAWEKVLEGAQLVQVMLQELNLPAFLKTSGGKGLHVVVPLKQLHGWDVVKAFSQAVVQHLADTIPERFVAKSGPTNRVGKIFVDYLRNGRGATTVSAWSARARPGLGISVPVAWSELASLTSGAHWTVPTVDERLRAGNSPWDGYAQAAVSLSSAMRLMGFNAKG